MSVSRLALLGALPVAVLCVGTSFAYGQSIQALPAQVRLVISGCGQEQPPFVDQLRIELLAAGVLQVMVAEEASTSEAVLDETADVATVAISLATCTPLDGSAHLGVASRASGAHHESQLSLHDSAPDARPRALALAAVELLRRHWREMVDPPLEVHTRTAPVSEPQPLPPSAPGPAGETEDGGERDVRPRLEWIGWSRIFPLTDSGDLSMTFGPALSAHGRVRWHAGMLLAGGGGDGAHMHMFEAGAKLGAFLVSRGMPAIEVGPTVEVGWSFLRAPDYAPGRERVEGVVAVAAVQASVRAPVTPGVDALVSLQAGYVVSPLTLQGYGMDGSVLGVGVGLAGLL